VKNLFNRFQDLTGGRQVTMIGLCVSATFGECLIQYPGGSIVSVKGAGEVGKRYFVQGNRLDGEAPDLPGLVIEV
jgi:hypothetical protein